MSKYQIGKDFQALKTRVARLEKLLEEQDSSEVLEAMTIDYNDLPTLEDLFEPDEMLAYVIPDEKIIRVNDDNIERVANIMGASISRRTWTVKENGRKVKYQRKRVTKRTWGSTITHPNRPILKGLACTEVPLHTCINIYKTVRERNGRKRRKFLYSTKAPQTHLTGGRACFCMKQEDSECYIHLRPFIQFKWSKRNCKGRRSLDNLLLPACYTC